MHLPRQSTVLDERFYCVLRFGWCCAGYEFVQVDQKGRVGIITLFRPNALNAINAGLVRDLTKVGLLDQHEYYYFLACSTLLACESSLKA